MSRRLQDARTEAARRRGRRHRIASVARKAAAHVTTEVLAGRMTFPEARAYTRAAMADAMAQELAPLLVMRALRKLAPLTREFSVRFSAAAGAAKEAGESLRRFGEAVMYQRSSWEIGAQVNDRRHRATPDGLVEPKS